MGWELVKRTQLPAARRPLYVWRISCERNCRQSEPLPQLPHYVEKLDAQEREVLYKHERSGFVGDCWHAIQRHFVDRKLDVGKEYLKARATQAGVYQSAGMRSPICLK